MIERTRGQGKEYGGVFPLLSGWQIEQQKSYKTKYNVALDGHHSIFYM